MVLSYASPFPVHTQYEWQWVRNHSRLNIRYLLFGQLKMQSREKANCRCIYSIYHTWRKFFYLLSKVSFKGEVGNLKTFLIIHNRKSVDVRSAPSFAKPQTPWHETKRLLISKRPEARSTQQSVGEATDCWVESQLSIHFTEYVFITCSLEFQMWLPTAVVSKLWPGARLRPAHRFLTARGIS